MSFRFTSTVIISRISSSCRLAVMLAGISAVALSDWLAGIFAVVLSDWIVSCAESVVAGASPPAISSAVFSRFASVTSFPAATVWSTASSVILSNRSIYSAAFSRLLLPSARLAAPALLPSAIAAATADRICLSSWGSVKVSSL